MRFILMTFIGIICSTAFANDSNYLSRYALQIQEDYLIVSWTTSEDFTCADVKVEHSLDSSNFSTIYTYPGICGAIAKEVDYFFLYKEIIFNKVNYFRINLGVYGYSEVKFVHIIRRTDLQPLVTPNPSDAGSAIHFSNDDRELVTIQIYNFNGNEVGPAVTSKNTKVLLSQFNGLTPGLHFFSITKDGIMRSGRFFFK
jgi:hypothetical protein